MSTPTTQDQTNLSPIEQLMQGPQQPTSTPASQDSLSPIEKLMQSQASTSDPSQSGEITNDVGQKVIVPKDGESFSDTLKRAVQYHNSLTPRQQQAAMGAETATIPAKAAQTVAAAPVIGAGGTALLAAPGEVAAGVRAIPGVTNALLQNAEEKAAEWAGQYPHLIKLAGALGIPTSTAALLGWMYHKGK
jgi:hypothetical protein